MRIHRWIAVLTGAVVLPASMVPSRAGAQSITTGAIGGVVTDSSGAPLADVSVQVKNLASGITAGALTRANGRYLVPSLEVGGPYSVTARRIGFASVTRQNVFVSLSQTTPVDVRLTAQAAQLAGVEVIATTSLFSETRKGIETTVDDSTIVKIPTMNRDFTDLVKLSPHVTSGQTDGPSAAGAYNRFNNFTIDGANQNDRFNLGASEGVPGGATGGRLISIDAVKEFQVLMTPADVRHGNFAGMIVNAVTKSGTNTFSGGVSYAYRDPELAANQPFIRNSDYKVHQYGFHLGGPIVKDKLHFFIAPELQTKAQPAIGPYTGQSTAEPGTVDPALLDRIANSVNQLFPIGGTGLVNNDNPLVNLSGRIDWAISPQHRFAIRQLINNAEQDEFSRNANTFSNTAGVQNSGYRYTSNSFIRKNTNYSTVAQLFSSFQNGYSNEFQVGYNTLKDERIVPVRAPEISVQVPVTNSQGGVSGNGASTFGTEQFSPGNLLDQKILEISNNFTMPIGKHAVTVGGRFENTEIFNNFAQRSYGVWSFASVDALEARTPITYSYGYSNGGPIEADFGVQQFALYAQDLWALTDRLSITYGLRADVPRFLDSPAENDRIATAFAAAGMPEIRTSVTPKSKALLSPRIGVNWDPTGNRSTQIRGVAGVFTGVTPLIMLGNAYANTGLGLVTLNCTNTNASTADDTPTFTVDVDNMPKACRNQPNPAPGQASTAGVNVNDEEFKYPQNFSASVGFDQRLPWNTTFTFEALYRKAINGVRVRDVNLKGPRLVGGQPYRDRNGRILYADTITNAVGAINVANANQRVMSTLSEGVIQVTNQSEDYSYSIAAGLRRRFGEMLNAGISYTYMQSYDMQSLTSDRAISNWRNGVQYSGLESDLPLTASIFSRPHRLALFGTITAPWKTTELSLYYNGNAGTPLTYVVSNGDLNGDGYNGNDPIYIPRDATDPNEIQLGAPQNPNAAVSATNPFVQNGQMAQDFENFIRENECLDKNRGKIMERNSCRTPWSQKIDISLRQSLPEWRGQRFTLQLDVFNFGNLLNKDWGQVELPVLSPTFADQRVLQARSRTAGPIGQSQTQYTFNTTVQQQGAFAKQQTLASNFYQMQFTLKYTF